MMSVLVSLYSSDHIMVNLHSVNFRSCLIFYIFLQLPPNDSSSHASTSHLTLWQNCCSVWNCCRLTRSTLARGKTHASAMSVRSLSDNRREWVVTCETRSLRYHTKIIFVRPEKLCCSMTRLQSVRTSLVRSERNHHNANTLPGPDILHSFSFCTWVSLALGFLGHMLPDSSAAVL